MTLQATQVVDLMVSARRGDSGELLVLDFEPADSPSQRLALLEEKLRCYAAFVDTGQYRERLPTVEPKGLLIRVLWHEPPTPEMSAIQAVCAHGADTAEIRIPVVFESETEARARVVRENPKRPWWKLW